jgi:hypothetical protein
MPLSQSPLPNPPLLLRLPGPYSILSLLYIIPRQSYNLAYSSLIFWGLEFSVAAERFVVPLEYTVNKPPSHLELDTLDIVIGGVNGSGYITFIWPPSASLCFCALRFAAWMLVRA